MFHLRIARAYARWLWRSAFGLGVAAFVQTGCQAIDHPERDVGPQALCASNRTAGPPAAMPNGTEVAVSTFRTRLEQDGSATNVKQAVLPVGLSESTGQPSSSCPGHSSQANIIDLSAALRLAGVDNPTIDLAEERIEEALANQLAARSLLIPSLNVGGNYRLHSGALQQSQGDIIRPTSQSLYLGAGAGAIGSGTVAVPGVWLFAHLGDAIYEPLAANRRVVARQSDAQSVRNSVLYDVAAAYLELVGLPEARSRVAPPVYDSERNLEIVRIGYRVRQGRAEALRRMRTGRRRMPSWCAVRFMRPGRGSGEPHPPSAVPTVGASIQRLSLRTSGGHAV